MVYINSTGYVFTKVPNPVDIKREIQTFTKGSGVKGTIIISSLHCLRKCVLST